MVESTIKTIQVKVKLFAIYQEVFDTPELDLVLLPQSTVNNVLQSLIEQKPQLAKWQEVTRFGVNLKFVSSDTQLQDGDEVVLIPPVSGG
ncbi:MoaD/ThiS family protein [Pleurocapsa sp. PCC 7319]|uniref:MoaD/ThiS family protein n=1 Tax=Pleurocapsa sp. PCC 7319 TaxID=118161 RepID=UPI00034CF470|nr:MoaD/ThiS family protein [Pleurocapsa sp. PCC 7319]